MSGVRNDAPSAVLDEAVRGVEANVRARYAGQQRAYLAALPTIRAYQQHYGAFGQTYHLLGQLESVALKGRPLASPGGVLVTAMFAAEIDHLLLTAGHDVEALSPPLQLDSSRDGERYVGMGGREHLLRAGDMVMRDSVGIISAVLSGPDQRTRVLPSTSRIMYVTYAPVGIASADVRQHLDDVARLVALAAPGCVVDSRAIYPAD